MTIVPVSQENLSPGNCVAATVFPKEILSLPINVATVYPKEILSPGNTVARKYCRAHALSFAHVFRGDMDQTEYGVLLAFCCNRIYPPLYNKNERDCLQRRAKSFVVKEGVLFYRDKEGGDFQVI